MWGWDWSLSGQGFQCTERTKNRHHWQIQTKTWNGSFNQWFHNCISFPYYWIVNTLLTLWVLQMFYLNGPRMAGPWLNLAETSAEATSSHPSFYALTRRRRSMDLPWQESLDSLDQGCPFRWRVRAKKSDVWSIVSAIPGAYACWAMNLRGKSILFFVKCGLNYNDSAELK